MKNTFTIQDVLEHIDIEKSLFKMQLNATYSADPKVSLDLFHDIQYKITERNVVKAYLENLIKEQ